MNKTSCNNYCNQVLKKEHEWLKEVDKFALTNTIYNMDSAYQKFFKEHTGFPKFKSKRDNKSHILLTLLTTTSKYHLGIAESNFRNLNGLKLRFIENLQGR